MKKCITAYNVQQNAVHEVIFRKIFNRQQYALLSEIRTITSTPDSPIFSTRRIWAKFGKEFGHR